MLIYQDINPFFDYYALILMVEMSEVSDTRGYIRNLLSNDQKL